MNELIEMQDEAFLDQTINIELFTRWIHFIDVKPKTVQTYTRAIRQFFYYYRTMK